VLTLSAVSVEVHVQHLYSWACSCVGFLLSLLKNWVLEDFQLFFVLFLVFSSPSNFSHSELCKQYKIGVSGLKTS